MERILPAPAGPSVVARAQYAWINGAQRDELSPAGAKRQVLAWIWYPAAQPTGLPAPYLPDAWREAMQQHTGFLMTRLFTCDPAMVRTHSWSGAGVSPQQSRYPVVIMRAGGGALTTDFTILAEDLASYGYVVVGFDAPYRTIVTVLPDGRVATRAAGANPGGGHAERLMQMWVDDTRFVVDQLERLNLNDPQERFTKRLDLQRLGMFGHSFGGATSLQFCHDDARCKAAIDVDGNPFGSVVKDGLKQPVLFLLSDHGDLSRGEEREVFGKIVSVYDHAPNGRWLLMLRHANHFSFSDQIVVKSWFVVKALQIATGGLEARRGLEISAAYVHTFFDVYLKGDDRAKMTALRRRFSEVTALR